ncbi:MAG: hypothetical protein WC260_01235 [Candidatus Pacearchaeota archaeon]
MSNDESISNLRSSEAEEIIGGLINAVERGESLQNAMQTFVNAGYDAQFLLKVAQRAYYDGQIPNFDSPQDDKNHDKSSNKKEKKNKLKIFDFKDDKQKKFYIILMIFIGAVVLFGALFLGLFWDKLFR